MLKGKVAGFVPGIVLLFSLNACAGPAVPLRVGTTEATVVDSETRQPLEGVVVIQRLRDAEVLRNGKVEHCDVKTVETRTDATGRFVLEGWTQYCKDAEAMLFTTRGEIDLYKPGYWRKTLRNSPARCCERIVWPGYWLSDWDGKVIELEPMHWRKWTKEEWETNLAKMKGSAISFEDCNWVNYPEVIVEDLRFSMRRAEVFHDSRWANWGKYWYEEVRKCGVSLFSLLEKQGFTRQEWETCCTYDPSPIGVVKISKNPDGTYSRSSVHANPIIRAAPPGVTDTGKSNGHGSEEAGRDHVER